MTQAFLPALHPRFQAKTQTTPGHGCTPSTKEQPTSHLHPIASRLLALLDKSLVITFVIPMPIETKVRKIGNSLGIVLPKEALQALKVSEGDTLFLTEAPECSLRITPERPGFEGKMTTAESLMNRYRNAFRELAK